MKNGRNTAEILGNDGRLDDMELWDWQRYERALLLKAGSAWRKEYLIARGAKEVRCARCGQIRPIADAVESE